MPFSTPQRRIRWLLAAGLAVTAVIGIVAYLALTAAITSSNNTSGADAGEAACRYQVANYQKAKAWRDAQREFARQLLDLLDRERKLYVQASSSLPSPVGKISLQLALDRAEFVPTWRDKYIALPNLAPPPC